MKTLKSLKLSTVIENSNIDATLIRAIVRWHGGWDEFKEISSDISKYGANTGISFIYYTDSVKFFRNHAPAIKSWLKSLSEEYYYDHDSVGSMMDKWDLVSQYTIEEINQALYTGKGDAVDQVFDVACKAVVEEIARAVVDSMEE
jgi:hypothetical protein